MVADVKAAEVAGDGNPVCDALRGVGKQFAESGHHVELDSM